MKHFDLLVLGGGSGGLAMAQRAASYGARVALFEPNRLGGTCVNVGCVPKKVMWNAAEIAKALAGAPAHGFDVAHARHDWRELKHRRDTYIERLNRIYQSKLDNASVVVVPRAGAFAGPNAIADEQGNVYSADHIVIATGGHPKTPALPGAALGINSDDFFALKTLPKRAAVVGSGYVAVELAGVLASLGSEVQLFVRYERVLRDFDDMLGTQLLRHLRSSGIAVETGALPRALSDREPLTLELQDGRRYGRFDVVLWAIGRAPNTASLRLACAGIQPTPSGFVPVDHLQNTRVANIYAVGDVTGRSQLTPTAIAAGRRLADRLFGGKAAPSLRYDVTPTVIFSHPPIGSIGLSEGEARRRHPQERVSVYTSEFVPTVHALGDSKPLSAMKLVVVGEEERVVGCHVIGPGADEMLQGFAIAMTMGATKRDFDNTIAIHPTSAEEFLSMRHNDVGRPTDG